MHSLDAILIRASIGWGFSSFVIVGYEWLYAKYYKNKQIPLSLGFFMVLIVLINKIASFYMGAVGLLLLFPTVIRARFELTYATGGIAGLLVASIVLQAAQNMVRRTVGLPTRPMQWIRHAFHSGRRK